MTEWQQPFLLREISVVSAIYIMVELENCVRQSVTHSDGTRNLRTLSRQ